MKINFMEKNILVTKNELSKASVYGSKEYHELLAIRKDLPDYQIVTKPTPPRTYCSPTYKFMESYIASCEDAASLYEEFQHLRQCGCNYATIKKWFMEKISLNINPIAVECH